MKQTQIQSSSPFSRVGALNKKEKRHEANKKTLVISNREDEGVDNSNSLIEINSLFFGGFPCV